MKNPAISNYTLRRFAFLTFMIFSGVRFADAQVQSTEDTAPPVIVVDRQEDKFSQELISALSRHIDEGFLKTTPQGAFYPVCLALSIDEKGNIINVYTSLNLSATIKRFLKPGMSLLQAMRKTAHVYGRYRGKTVIFPIMFIRADSASFANNKAFVNDLQNIWPDFPADQSRPVVLLKPFVYRFAYPRRY